MREGRAWLSGDDPAGLLIALLLRKDAAAVFLHVEAELPRALLAVAEHGAEVLIVELDAVFLRRAVADIAHQLMLLIGADEQRGRERVKAALLRHPRRLEKAHLIAFDAAAGDILRDRADEGPQAVVVALDQEQQNTLKRYVGFDNDEKCFILAYENEARYPGEVIKLKSFEVQGIARHVIKAL